MFVYLYIIDLRIRLYMKQKLVVSNSKKREDKGRVLALSRNVYKVDEDFDGYTDTLYKVESESSDNSRYYLVRYETFGLGLSLGLKWCTCPDFSTNSKNEKCKHIFAVEYAIKMKTLKNEYSF